ncbi:MAG: hypothetical protein ACXIU8_09420 [Alkalilacustris sp.]
MHTGRFRDHDLEAARAVATPETHIAHVFPHPVWDGGDRIQLHVFEDPAATPDYFVELACPLDTVFRAGLGRVLAEIGAELDPAARLAAEDALMVEFTGFWHLCDRIEEGFLKRMLVVTRWAYTTRDGHRRTEGFDDGTDHTTAD